MISVSHNFQSLSSESHTLQSGTTDRPFLPPEVLQIVQEMLRLDMAMLGVFRVSNTFRELIKPPSFHIYK
ncbi:unnamed protein product [Arctogadus glacialis]